MDNHKNKLDNRPSLTSCLTNILVGSGMTFVSGIVMNDLYRQGYPHITPTALTIIGFITLGTSTGIKGLTNLYRHYRNPASKTAYFIARSCCLSQYIGGAMACGGCLGNALTKEKNLESRTVNTVVSTGLASIATTSIYDRCKTSIQTNKEKN